MFKYLNLHTLNQHRLTHYSTPYFDTMPLIMDDNDDADFENEDEDEGNAGVLFCSVV